MTTLTKTELQTFVIDPSHSRMGFTVGHMGFSKVRGIFETFEGTVRMASGDLSSLEAHATIQTASITSSPQSGRRARTPPPRALRHAPPRGPNPTPPRPRVSIRAHLAFRHIISDNRHIAIKGYDRTDLSTDPGLADPDRHANGPCIKEPLTPEVHPARPSKTA